MVHSNTLSHAVTAPRFLLWSLIGMLAGCGGVTYEPLMPTPEYYRVHEVGPLDDLPRDERWTIRRVYYVTNRERDQDLQRIDYTNEVADQINVGLAAIGFGTGNISWGDLNRVSMQSPREQEVPLSIAGMIEVGSYRVNERGEVVDSQGATAWLLGNINTALKTARNKDVLVYVHGAKVNFYNACVFAAQLDHFLGRDMTSLAFSWPTRQNILAYALGGDIKRGQGAVTALISTLDQLARRTRAERIHIVTWSAGGRVVTAALGQLREQNSHLSAAEMRDQFRIGTVYFAAADVPVDFFVDNLTAINDSVNRLVVTASEHDGALRSSEMFIGGSDRIGLLNPQLSETQRKIVRAADRLEYVDMSQGAARRGFDITGHRYWFDHPWASTDMLLSIKTDLGPEQRGMNQGAAPMVWWMPGDYPERVKSLGNVLQDY